MHYLRVWQLYPKVWSFRATLCQTEYRCQINQHHATFPQLKQVWTFAQLAYERFPLLAEDASPATLGSISWTRAYNSPDK